MKTIYALLAAGMAVIAATPAFAQATDQDAATTPAQAFSGAHVEATFGWDHLDNKSYKDIDATAQVQGSSDGVTYGGALGYDFALTNTVTLGAEVGLYGSSAKWNNAANLVAGTFNTAQVNPGRDIYVGGRIGYALSRKTDLFAKAGYTNQRFGVTGTDGTNVTYQAINENGFRLGAGVEHKLTKATYVKLEYDYSHYGSGQFNYANSTPDGSNFDLHNDQHQVLASVGLRF
jgi:outer membrane immunogenic protein